MRRCGLLACCFLLLGVAAEADILKMRAGDELRGTAQLVTFVVKDIQTIYPREEVVAMQVATTGADSLETRSEGKVEGKLVSVMFDAPGGLRAVTRDKIASLSLDNTTTMDSVKAQQKDETDKKEEQKQELSEEQKRALTKNRELYGSYKDAAEQMKDDGYEAVKTKYSDRVREVINDAQRLDRSIQEKIRRREQASTRSYSTSHGGSTTTISERERLERQDGLERDRQDLERARATGTKLKATIRAEEKKVKDKAEERLSRVETAYTGLRAKLFEGQTLTEDEMTARYEAAIRLPGEKAPKVTKPKTTKTSPEGGTGKTTTTGAKTPKTKQGLEDIKGE